MPQSYILIHIYNNFQELQNSKSKNWSILPSMSMMMNFNSLIWNLRIGLLFDIYNLYKMKNTGLDSSNFDHVKILNSKLIYDNYQTNFEEGSKEDVYEIMPITIFREAKGKLLPFSFPSTKYQKNELYIINGI
jgi:hypothetical protein